MHKNETLKATIKFGESNNQQFPFNCTFKEHSIDAFKKLFTSEGTLCQ